MTEEEAVRLLWVERVFARMVDGSEFVLLKPTAAKKVSELIEQQAQEVAKKDRMIERVIPIISRGCCDFKDCKGTTIACDDCWREWLEKEAGVQ